MNGNARKDGSKRNCWEAMACGREPGGANAGEKGICPAALETRADGINGGTNGGRACWAIAGTLCGGQLQGSFAVKMADCMYCPFYREVRAEEGDGFVPPITILLRLNRAIS